MRLIYNYFFVVVFSIVLACVFTTSASAVHLFGHKDHKVILINDLSPRCTATIIWWSAAKQLQGGICSLQKVQVGEKVVYEYTDAQRQGKMEIMAVVEVPGFTDKVQVTTCAVSGAHKKILLSHIVSRSLGEYGDKEEIFTRLTQRMAS